MKWACSYIAALKSVVVPVSETRSSERWPRRGSPARARTCRYRRAPSGARNRLRRRLRSRPGSAASARSAMRTLSSALPIMLNNHPRSTTSAIWEGVESVRFRERIERSTPSPLHAQGMRAVAPHAGIGPVDRQCAARELVHFLAKLGATGARVVFPDEIIDERAFSQRQDEIRIQPKRLVGERARLLESLRCRMPLDDRSAKKE